VPALGTVARYTLGGIRLVNGALALVAPAVIQKRLGDPAAGGNAAAIYALRMFGVRTVVLGADLIRLRGEALRHVLHSALLIHASDTATVLMLHRNKQLSPELARPLALVSGLNTVLAGAAILADARTPVHVPPRAHLRLVLDRLPRPRKPARSTAVQETR
jgi:hypothetical protein